MPCGQEEYVPNVFHVVRKGLMYTNGRAHVLAPPGHGAALVNTGFVAPKLTLISYPGASWVPWLAVVSSDAAPGLLSWGRSKSVQPDSSSVVRLMVVLGAEYAPRPMQ